MVSKFWVIFKNYCKEVSSFGKYIESLLVMVIKFLANFNKKLSCFYIYWISLIHVYELSFFTNHDNDQQVLIHNIRANKHKYRFHWSYHTNTQHSCHMELHTNFCGLDDRASQFDLNTEIELNLQWLEKIYEEFQGFK